MRKLTPVLSDSLPTNLTFRDRDRSFRSILQC